MFQYVKIRKFIWLKTILLKNGICVHLEDGIRNSEIFLPKGRNNYLFVNMFASKHELSSPFHSNRRQEDFLISIDYSIFQTSSVKLFFCFRCWWQLTPTLIKIYQEREYGIFNQNGTSIYKKSLLPRLRNPGRRLCGKIVRSRDGVWRQGNGDLRI